MVVNVNLFRVRADSSRWPLWTINYRQDFPSRITEGAGQIKILLREKRRIKILKIVEKQVHTTHICDGTKDLI